MRITKKTTSDEVKAEIARRSVRRREAARERYWRDPVFYRCKAQESYAERMDAKVFAGCVSDIHFSDDDRKLFKKIFEKRHEFRGLARTKAEWVIGNFKAYTPMVGWQEEAKAALSSLN